MHKENECKIFSSSKYKYEPQMLHDLPCIITQTRAICIKTISPNIWNDLSALLSGTTPYDDEWKLKNEGNYNKFAKKLLPHFNEKEREEAVQSGLTLRKNFMRRGFYFNAQNTVDLSRLTR